MKKGNYIINTLNGMAYGFFCSLIVGTILKQIGVFFNIEELIEWGTIASYLMGPAIGVGIAYAIEAKGLNLIVAIIAGAIGTGTFANGSVSIGNPIGAYIAVIMAVEVTKWVQGKTPVDILLVPITSIVVGGTVTIFVSPYVEQVIVWIGSVVNTGVTMQPFFMSVVVSVLMGMALTAPISSTAIAVMLNLSGLAAGAALAGCCAQMIGFAVMMLDDNDIGDVIAVGIGTSMLQFKNIIKKPIIWIPPIMVSAVTGPIATMVLGVECNAVGAGMGTSGFIGILSAVEVMGSSAWISILSITIVAPIVLTYVIFRVFKKMKYIKKGDLTLIRL